MGTTVIDLRRWAVIASGGALALVFVTGDTSSSAAAAGLSIGSVILFVVIVALYFLPTIIAALRHHHNTAMIAILNFFLGWTFVGWVIFLAMSFGNPSPQQTIIHNVYSGPAASPPIPTPASNSPVASPSAGTPGSTNTP